MSSKHSTLNQGGVDALDQDLLIRGEATPPTSHKATRIILTRELHRLVQSVWKMVTCHPGYALLRILSPQISGYDGEP